MRHFLASGSVATLALSVIEAATTGALIAVAGGSERCAAGQIRTRLTAIDIAPIAVTADRNLAVTAGTVVETGSVLHRQQ
jgi:hypothetical protein